MSISDKFEKSIPYVKSEHSANQGFQTRDILRKAGLEIEKELADHLLSKYYETAGYESIAVQLKREALKFVEIKWSGEENLNRLIEFQSLIESSFSILDGYQSEE